MSDWNGIPEHWGRGHYRDVPIGKWVRLARERQVRDLQRQNTPEFPFVYDDKAADRAVWFFSLLRHFKGKQWRGRPFILEAWQEWDLIRPIYGWKNLDGLRRFRRMLLKIGRKDGKTQLGAGMGAYALRGDDEPGAECYCAATKEEQAKIAWRAARLMVKGSPVLAAEIQASTKSLFCPDTESFFKPLGRDSNTQDGLDVHFALVDEYHAHKTDEMLGVLETGTGAREQPLIVITSTEGLTRGPLKDEEDLGRKILEGIIQDEQYLPYLCEVDDPDAWEDEREWYKANPMLGISLKLEDFRAEAQRAKESSSRRIHFKVKRLNIPCDSRSVWIAPEVFRRCAGPVDWSKFAGKRCYVGLDLGQTRDISALALAFMDEKDAEHRSDDDMPQVYLRMFYWIPEVGMVERWREDGVCYPLWKEQGWISTTPGETTRIDYVRAKIKEVAGLYEIAEFAADKWNAAELMQALEDDGIKVVPHPQSLAAMSFPCKTFEKLVLQGRIRHNDDPVLAWMVSNAVAFTDGNENIKLMKNKSKDRIDGVVAASMAIGRLLIAPEPVNFVYNVRGLYVG